MNRIASMLILMLCYSISMAQLSDKDLKKHQKQVEKSLDKGKPVISFDTLFNEGKPYCLFIEDEKMLGTLLRATVKEFGGKEVMWILYKDKEPGEFNGNYEVTFVESGQKARIPVDLALTLEKEIVKYELFAEGNFNAGAENKFIQMHPLPNQKNITIQISTDQSPTMVDRNRSGMVMIMGTNIQQSGQVVGHFTKNTNATGGQLVNEMEFFLPGGQKVARATSVGATSHDWEVVTLKDNKQHSISSSLGHDAEDVATFLIKLMYL